eukprot:CAMPEP_0184977078 /NCGR_PEP_ID=MMETSP1098-20130426/7839_1 /TAXON_ID=89044 /ORGANISM="Spumella elongata, Strain CCAP 955/1" /LENGTH=2266 /DNA_ID=CAMNT_0027500023 /DNA_START=378 /DNA_END=7178 /DNA_ORIENTATION=+
MCSKWFLGYSSESCSQTCGRVNGTCVFNHLRKVVTQAEFYKVVASATRIGSGPTGPATTFCNVGINLYNFAPVPAAFTFQTYNEGGELMQQTYCNYPTSVAALVGDCDSVFAYPPSQRFCSCEGDYCGPSVAPSVAPTNAPVFAPTAVPTYTVTNKPSNEPSVRPTTLPSVAPTYPPIPGTTRNYSQSLRYNEMSYKHGFLVGGCLPWTDFLSDISMMFNSVKPSIPQKIEILGVPDVFHAAPAFIQCSDPVLAQEIAYALVYPSVVPHTVMCQNNTWKVQECNGGQPVVCVGCDSPCSATQDASNPFVVGACGDTAGKYPRTAFMTLTSAYYSALLNLFATTQVSQNSIELTVNMSYPGTVHCGALEHGATLYDLRMIDAFNLLAYLPSPGLIPFKIRDLKPNTLYDVYCYTTTWYWSKINTAAAILSKLEVATAACSPLRITYQHEYVFRGAGLLDFVTLQLALPPKEVMVVSVYAQITSGNVTEDHWLQTFEFSHMFFGIQRVALPAQLTTSGDFVTVFVNMTDAYGYVLPMYNCSVQYDGGAFNSGNGTRNATAGSDLNGVVGADVSAAHGNSRGVALISLQPVIPVVSAVTFNGDCSAVNVVFTSPTNKGGVTTTYFPCDTLLTFNLASSTMCRWADSVTLIIQLDSNSKLMVGDTVVANGNSIRARCPTGLEQGFDVTVPAMCDFWALMETSTHTIAAPTSGVAVLPIVDIIGPTLLNAHDGIWFSTEYSVGMCSRRWQSIAFTVTTPMGTFQPAETDLNTRFLYFNEGNQSVVSYAPGAFPIGEYNFGVTMCNYLGNCGFNIIRIVVRATVAPIVNIMGPRAITINAGDALTLFADVYMYNRSSTGQYYGMVPRETFLYSWFLLQNEVSFSSYITAERYSEQQFLHFTPYKFLAGQSYEVRLVSLSTTNWKSSTYSVTVYVKRSPLVAIILGASVQTVRAGECITLDGGQSYDEEALPNLLTDQPFGGSCGELMYNWQYSQTYPTVSTSSGFNVSYSHHQVRATVCAPSNQKITTNFRMTVTMGERTAHTHVVVHSVHAHHPVLAVGNTFNQLNPTGRTMNENDKVKILGNVTTNMGGNLYWTVNDTSVDMASRALSLIAKTFLASPSQQFVDLNLLLVGNTLPGRSAYTFSLHCDLEDTTKLVSSVVVEVNGAPLAGKASVMPESGIAFADVFTFFASNWYDEDLPLSYMFSYDAPDGTQKIMKSRCPQTYVKSMLPSGSAAHNDLLTWRVKVYDLFLASREADGTLQVSFLPRASASPAAQLTLAAQNSSTKMSTIVQSMLTTEEYLAGYSFTKMVNLVNLASSALNRVESDDLPDCAALRRKDIEYTHNTCGPCGSTELIGTPGYSNSMCYFPYELDNRDLSCTVDDECISWERCDTTTSQCVVADKSCPGDCNNNGVCSFVDIVNGAELSECSWATSTCRAVCTCSPDWYGPGCEKPADDLALRQTQRSVLTKDLVSVISRGMYDEVALTAWIGALKSVTQVPEELTMDLVKNLTVTTFHFLNRTKALEVPSEVAAPLLDVFDSLLLSRFGHRFAGTPSDTVYEYYHATRVGLLKLNDAIQSDMITGQFDFSFTKNLLRTMYVDRYRSPTEAEVLYSPLSAFEQHIGVQAASISSGVVPNTIGDAQLVLSSSRINDQLWQGNSKFLSESVLLDINYQSDCAGGGYCDVEVEFHHDPVVYNTTQLSFNSTASVTCQHGVAQNHTFPCANGNNVTIECDGDFYGVIFAACPYEEEYPICRELYSNERTVAESCRVTNHTATSTTCRCTVYVANDSGDWKFQQRRLLDMVDLRDLPERRTNSSLEVIPVKMYHRIDAQRNYTHDPTSQPSSQPSSHPSASPSASPSFVLEYPIYSFNLRSLVTLDVPTPDEVVLSARDNQTIVNATHNVWWETLNLDVRLTNVTARRLPSGAHRLTLQLNSYIRQAKWCQSQDAINAFSLWLLDAVTVNGDFVRYMNQHGLDVGSPLQNAVGVSVTSQKYGTVGHEHTSASACTYRPTMAPTSAAGVNSGGETSGRDSTMSSSDAIDYLGLYMAGLVLFAILSVVYVFYSNRNKAILSRDVEERERRPRGLLSETSSNSDASSVSDMVSSGHGSVVEAPMVYNDATGNFEYDTQYYNYNDAEPADMLADDQQAPTAAYDWTDMDADLPMTEAVATGDFFSRPGMSLGSEADSTAAAAPAPAAVGARGPASAPAKKSSTGSKVTNPLRTLAKKSSGKALNLTALKDKKPSTRPARDVNAANTSWNEAYSSGRWGDDQQS